jgi:polysaccharide pyruvyl transferase WcaK-like protein
LKRSKRKRNKISLFGHFGQINFGNESTLQAILYHLHRHIPDAETTCICTYPDVTTRSYNIDAVPMTGVFVKPLWLRGNPAARFLRKIIIGIPSELYRWLAAIRILKGMGMLIVPGTGLLTDVCGLSGWGPYTMFKWSLVAKLCRCKLLFVSVGAGPVYSALGKYFVKSALSLADFRSYRDNASLEYLKGIGFPTNSDRVYPDLVFSLPEAVIPSDNSEKKRRSVVGLGLMEYYGKPSVDSPGNAIYLAYLENLVVFLRWLLAHEYDARLLIGDVGDRRVTEEFKSLLKERSLIYDEARIIDEPVSSVEHLLSQLAATDIVVATRFHNVLLALLLNKPVISISFHHKCASLMSEMGLGEYCHDINHMNAGRLIEQFQDVERNAEKLKPVIRQKVEQSRKALDEQYSLIFKGV